MHYVTIFIFWSLSTIFQTFPDESNSVNEIDSLHIKKNELKYNLSEKENKNISNVHIEVSLSTYSVLIIIINRYTTYRYGFLITFYLS